MGLLASQRHMLLIPVAADIDTPSSDTAAVVTYAADDEARHIIYGVKISYDGNPTGGSITIARGATTVLDLDIATEGIKNIPLDVPIVGAKNEAMTITLAAGGASVTGKLFVQHRTTLLDAV